MKGLNNMIKFIFVCLLFSSAVFSQDTLAVTSVNDNNYTLSKHFEYYDPNALYSDDTSEVVRLLRSYEYFYDTAYIYFTPYSHIVWKITMYRVFSTNVIQNTESNLRAEYIRRLSDLQSKYGEFSPTKYNDSLFCGRKMLNDYSIKFVDKETSDTLYIETYLERTDSTFILWEKMVNLTVYKNIFKAEVETKKRVSEDAEDHFNYDELKEAIENNY
jgi:hypothetical protein